MVLSVTCRQETPFAQPFWRCSGEVDNGKRGYRTYPDQTSDTVVGPLTNILTAAIKASATALAS